jgi:uncharacterized repeat protein (TIGR03943 family)
MKKIPRNNLLAGLLCLVLGAIIIGKAASGDLALYIHPRYTLLLLGTGIFLALIGTALPALPPVSLRRSLLLLPLAVVVLALVVPARPLGASLVSSKSLDSGSNDALIARWQAKRSDDTTTWTLLEWTAATKQQPLKTLEGKPARFEGFVYRTPDLPPDEVRVGRYVITCCTADGTALSMNVTGPNVAALKADTWVRVEGTFAPLVRGGKMVLLITGTLTPLDTPSVPYLYP